MWHWHANRRIELWNKKESPEVDMSNYGNVVLIKVASQIIGVKKDLFIKVLGQLGGHLELDQYLTVDKKLASND